MDRDDPAVAPTWATARRRFAFLALLWLAPLVFLGVFYFYPLGSILALSFRRAEGGWLGPLLDTLTAPSVLRVLWFTFYQAGLSTALTLAGRVTRRIPAGALRIPWEGGPAGPDRDPFCPADPGRRRGL